MQTVLASAAGRRPVRVNVRATVSGVPSRCCQRPVGVGRRGVRAPAGLVWVVGVREPVGERAGQQLGSARVGGGDVTLAGSLSAGRW